MQLRPLTAGIIGVLGGIIMAILMLVDFKLYYLTGYLYIILILVILYIGLYIYRRLHNEILSYGQRFLLSLTIYAAMTLSYVLCKLLFDNSFGNHNTIEELIKLILIALAFGIVLSLITACCFKRNSIKSP